MAEVGTVRVGGIDATLEADRHGMWRIYEAVEEGERRMLLGSGEKLDTAKREAAKTLRKRRIEVQVPFRFSDGERAVATGRNARRKITVLRADGSKDEIDGWGRGVGGLYSPDTPESVIERYAEILAEANRLQSERNEIESQWTIRVDQLVDAAIEAAAESES